MNTRHYIVSFGDSRKYAYAAPEQAGANPFAEIEKSLDAYLQAEFPDHNTFAYYTTAQAEEVDPAACKEYVSLPTLDARAVNDIKRVLADEIRNEDFQDTLDSNAPWTDIS